MAINLFDIITQSKINMDNNIQDDKKQTNKKKSTDIVDEYELYFIPRIVRLDS